MVEQWLSELINDVLRPLQEEIIPEQEAQEMSFHQLQLLLDDIEVDLQGHNFHELNGQVADCQELLQELHNNNRNIREDIMLIRQMLLELQPHLAYMVLDEHQGPDSL